MVGDSSTTKTGRHDIVEILLKVALKTPKSNQYQIKYKIRSDMSIKLKSNAGVFLSMSVIS
jgi:hypothetical protein